MTVGVVRRLTHAVGSLDAHARMAAKGRRGSILVPSLEVIPGRDAHTYLKLHGPQQFRHRGKLGPHKERAQYICT